MSRAIFLDRDGTVIEECGYLTDPERVRLLPGAALALHRLSTEGWKLFVVSNQSGVGRGLIAPGQMHAVQSRFLETLETHGISVAESYLCIHSPEENCECRKPSPRSLERAARDFGVELESSWMIGDREGDILCGRNAGCSTVWLRNTMFEVAPGLPTFVANDWDEIYRRIGRGEQA